MYWNKATDYSPAPEDRLTLTWDVLKSPFLLQMQGSEQD